MAFKKATVSIDDWLKSTGATERPKAQQNTAAAQKPVTEPISEPVPQKKKEKYTEHWFMELQPPKRRSIIWIMTMSADW